MPQKRVFDNKKDKWNFFKFKSTPYLFVSPFFISFAVFAIFPIMYSLMLSFNSWDAVTPMRFVGLRNYFNIIIDNLFWQSMLNTFAIGIITAIPQHLLALFFAFVLNLGLVRFKEFFKSVLFLPYLTSSVAIALVAGILFGYRYGLLNFWLSELEKLHLIGSGGLIPMELPVEWLRRTMAWFSIASLAVWKWTGWNAIIYLAGLQAIPGELYEAARIDGANWGDIFFKITLPLLKPVILVATTMTIIGQLQLFDDPMVLFGGSNQLGGGAATGRTLAVYLYIYAFQYMKFGMGAAASYFIFLLIIILSSINRKVLANN